MTHQIVRRCSPTQSRTRDEAPKRHRPQRNQRERLEYAASGSMNWSSTREGAMRITSWGHALFAATMISLGILGLIQRDFTPIWLPVPKGVPAREVLVYLSAIAPLVSGIGLLWRRHGAAAY